MLRPIPVVNLGAESRPLYSAIHFRSFLGLIFGVPPLTSSFVIYIFHNQVFVSELSRVEEWDPEIFPAYIL